MHHLIFFGNIIFCFPFSWWGRWGLKRQNDLLVSWQRRGCIYVWFTPIFTCITIFMVSQEEQYISKEQVVSRESQRWWEKESQLEWPRINFPILEVSTQHLTWVEGFSHIEGIWGLTVGPYLGCIQACFFSHPFSPFIMTKFDTCHTYNKLDYDRKHLNSPF